MKLLAVLSLCFCGTTFCSTETFKIAVVNLANIAKQSKAGQSIDKQLADINNQSKAPLLDLENNIRKMVDNAKTSSDKRKVEDLQVILYDMTKKRRFQIQSAYKNALKTLEEAINAVIKNIAIDKGYTLVTMSDIVMYRSDKCDDITEEVIARLDKYLPMIEVTMIENLEEKNRTDEDINFER